MEKIQDYALIGNGRTAALISKKGSLDWLCLPRFDSPSLFGALLDDQIGGFWKISPTSSSRKERRYMEETNVLQTYFHTAGGTACLTDFMTAFSEEEKQKTLQPTHELIRIVESLNGEIEIFIQYNPRPNYGQVSPKLHDFKKFGIRFKYKQHLITLQSTIALSIDLEGAKAVVRLKKGEKIFFSLTYNDESPAILPNLDQIPSKLEATHTWWKKWSAKCQYEGPYRKQVVRSALTLKLLSFAPSGAFIAAPTTSLPEKIKGDLNWDYRFCWLRDAAFTVHALFSLGYNEDAEAFVSWLLHSTRLTLPNLKVLYDVYGRNPGKEILLTHLNGYQESKPVRIRNAAKNQFQLDCYGEVIDAVASFIKEGGKLDSEMKKMLSLFGKYICDNWEKKDNGIWEYRESTEHYTYSKLMCWVALDRLIKINKELQLKKPLLNRFLENRDRLRSEIENKGWNEALQTYTESFEGKTLDVCVLLMPFYGFAKAGSSRLQKTFQRIREALYHQPSGLTYRGWRSLADKEGAFMMCSFWIAEFLAKGGGSLEEANEIFSKLASLSNDVGLFSEEIDPETLDALGNFPQAFTHIALINAALALKKREEER